MPLPLTTVFADPLDPRIETVNKLHKLTDILVTTTCDQRRDRSRRMKRCCSGQWNCGSAVSR